MTLVASLINWSALWKIILAALVGGAGVVIVFGFLLLGLGRARQARSPGARFASLAVSGLCGVACVGAIALGIYALTQKPPSPKKPPKPTSAAVNAPAGRRTKLIASAP